jgi:hypothetical protein
MQKSLQTPQRLECRVALKEWAATGEALRQGRQIILLRKGGIHDAEGVFELEHSRFWLFPTWLHQAQNLVKLEHRDLLEIAEAAREFKTRDTLHFSLYCEVAQVWTLREEHQSTLMAASHIWSDDYLNLRFGYKPEHPLLCVAVRAWELPVAQAVANQSKYFGCRSWIELDAALSTTEARPVLDESTFQAQLKALEKTLGGTIG